MNPCQHRFRARSFSRPRLALVSLTVGVLSFPLFAPVAVRAGSYTFAYSGGTITASPLPPGQPAPTFSAGEGYSGGDTVTAYPPDMASVKVDDSASVTATLTWQPASGQTAVTDPPPTAAICLQTSDTSWDYTANGTASGSGSADCGLPNPWASTSATGGQSNGVNYSTQGSASAGSPLTAFSVSCPAKASFSGGGGSNPRDSVTGSADVSYGALAYPVFVNLSGTTLVNGTQELLTGQPCTASLTVGRDFFGDACSCTFSNYKWDIESSGGGSVVGGYIAQQAQGMTIPPASFQNPTITFYDGIQDTVTVNVTATVTYPDNTTGSLSATAMLTVVKPTVTSHDFTIKEVDTFTSDPNNVGPRLGAEEDWSNVTIGMPPGFSGGSGCFAQILQSTTEYDSRQTGGNYTIQEKLSNGQWVPIPAPCLDTDFPYPYANEWTVGTNGVGMGGDDPFFPVSPPLDSDDPGKPDWNKASGKDQFRTWVMYNPNPQSGNNIWVPLSNFDWNWNDTASLDTSVTPQIWRAGTFTGDKGLDFAPAVEWPVWNTWIPFTIINNSQTGTVAMHE